jgi:hypothetical protein
MVRIFQMILVGQILLPTLGCSPKHNPIPANAQTADAQAAAKLKDIAEHLSWNAAGNVMDADLHGDYVTDAVIDDVNNLKHLETLGLGPSELDDSLLARLEPNRITSLGLAGTRITDKGIADLTRFENLVCLDLNHTRISDASVAHLRRLGKLQYLFIEGTGITDDGERQLREQFPKCHIQRSGVTKGSLDEQR